MKNPLFPKNSMALNCNQTETLPLWRQLQKKNFTKLKALVQFLELSDEQEKALLRRPSFPLNIPIRLAEKIEKGNLNDPLLLQFLPTDDELQKRAGFDDAPVKDELFCKSPRLLCKYPGRALLLLTSACAMHCRYCFRQNFPYSASDHFEKELQLIAEDQTLSEIILSGGDPLSLSDNALSLLIDELNAISHLKRLRFHTRFPIGIPERVTSSFLRILQKSRLQIWFVVHINHPKELDKEVSAALGNVRRLGIPVLNQAVLLKGVNDDITTLSELSLRLADEGISFYYLHQLDKVTGSHRFEVKAQRGIELIEQLRACSSGYAVPNYVREIPGKQAKTPVSSTCS